jgi:23S rRNA pseudouridine2605 synthase
MQKRNDIDTPAEADTAAPSGERIAKVLARAGVASRRDAEKLIAAGRIKVNGKLLDTPAFKVTSKDKIEFDNAPITRKEPTRLWRYHKPSGLLTSHKDPQGRPTVFEHLPKDMPRVISVGRLDMTSEGLLLLTNDGELARLLELPSTAWARRYRARAYGRITQDRLDTLQKGIEIDGIPTGPIEATIDRQQGDNAWINVTLREGKNREVRRALDTLGLRVNRLIRVSYGPFQLSVLPSGEIEEVKNRILRDQVGHLMEIEQTRPGGTLTGAAKRGGPASKGNAKGASPRGQAGSARPMPQGKGRHAKPKRGGPSKAMGGRDVSAKDAKKMIADRSKKKADRRSQRIDAAQNRPTQKPANRRPSKAFNGSSSRPSTRGSGPSRSGGSGRGHR